VILDDKRTVRIRPLAAGDTERSLAFFSSLPDDERRYFRRDVTRREVIEERIQEVLNDKADRIVALRDDRIVADASLIPERFRWAEGIAEIRVFVAPDFRGCGLGLRLVRELYVLAHKRDLARINARFMAPQTEARAIFSRLGFEEEFVIPKHVKDARGEWQDLVLMRCDLADLMAEPLPEPEATPEPSRPENAPMAEIDVLERFAVRWALLAAWNDELEGRGVRTPHTLAHKLEESRVLIASGCFTSCDVGTALEAIEADLVSADGSSDESSVDRWMDLLGAAMSDPASALGVPAVKFRYADCNRALCACGVAR
jgi:L-amino acid N-acyltransferase YncA